MAQAFVKKTMKLDLDRNEATQTKVALTEVIERIERDLSGPKVVNREGNMQYRKTLEEVVRAIETGLVDM